MLAIGFLRQFVTPRPAPGQIREQPPKRRTIVSMTDPVTVPVIDAEPVASVLRTLQLTESGNDVFYAESLPQVRRVYGGQVVAQALLAAAATLPVSERLPHSLHAYFLRGGDPDRYLTLEVARLRDGRSFSSRQVSAKQDGEEILSLNASFQAFEEGLEFSGVAPIVPGPDQLTSALEIFRSMSHPVAKFLGKTAAFDVRHVQSSLYTGADPSKASVQQLWMKPRNPLPRSMSQLLHRTLLAYVVDQVMLEPALRATGLSWLTEGMSLASLDHAMWFHKDVDINEWLLFSGRVVSVGGGRAKTDVDVFSKSGVLVASASQEGMIRIPTGVAQGSGRWGFESSAEALI